MAIDIDQAIGDFWAGRQRGEHFPPAYFDRLSLDEAYRIQLGVMERRIAAGERQIGWKMGLTAKAIQEQFGFTEPVFGCILETVESGHTFDAESLISPGFETELCMRLGHGLEGEITLEDASAAVASIHPAFEIIETRGDARQLHMLCADNSQQRSVVIGDPVPLEPQMALESVAARVWLNSEEVDAGEGSAVLGNPLNSIVWLAGKLTQYGRRLEAGDVIMTGSFVRQFPLAAGDIARAEFSGIGDVEVRVSGP